MANWNDKQRFPCPVCGQGLAVRETKKKKPYVVCDPCGVQVFVRNESGIRKFEKLVADAEERDIWKRIEELQHRYYKKCPKCGRRFWITPEQVKVDWFTSSFEGYCCPEPDCDGVVQWKEDK